MRVLVTGGGGFIGANLVCALAENGDDITVIDNFSSGFVENLAGISCEVKAASIVDTDLASAFAGQDAVVHLAAKTSVIESLSDPWPTFEVNAAGTLRILEASRQAQVPVFVFASSNAALGDHEPPLDESTLPQPISPYGASKVAGEAYCHSYGRTAGMRVAILRFSNAYGPFMLGKDSVIPRFIRAALSGEDLTIYGDGSQTRDFIHASDIVGAIQMSITSQPAKGVFQIATGVETSIDHLAHLIIRVCKSKSKVCHVDPREGEIHRNRSDISRASQILGFNPAMTIDCGIDLTAQWFQRQDRLRTIRSTTPELTSTLGE